MTQPKKGLVWTEWAKAVIIAVVLAFTLRTFGFSTSIVNGESMYPVLEDGERIVFNKFIYFVSDPDRGDIVIIEQANGNYVKRIIGLPNETIEMKDGVLYVNGELFPESFVTNLAMHQTGDFGPVTIPTDTYFVMGDNRAISKDSRNGLGFIHRSEIVGRSELIVYPFDQFSITR